MCCDAVWTDGEHVGRLRKVYRIGGDLYGACGNVASWLRWFDALKAAEPLPADDDSVRILRMSAVGLHTWDAANGWFPLSEPYAAIGTGADLAIGAMAAGAHVRDAVRIACARDAHSRGPVRTYRL